MGAKNGHFSIIDTSNAVGVGYLSGRLQPLPSDLTDIRNIHIIFNGVSNVSVPTTLDKFAISCLGGSASSCLTQDVAIDTLTALG